jgi:hypothetical protein
MARSALSALVALVSLTLVAGQSTTAAAPNGVPTFPTTPLVSEIFPYTALVRIFFQIIQTFFFIDIFHVQPQQVYPNQIVRGTQSGYNRCNSTTQNQDSLCQTILVNNISGALSSNFLLYMRLTSFQIFASGPLPQPTRPSQTQRVKKWVGVQRMDMAPVESFPALTVVFKY